MNFYSLPKDLQEEVLKLISQYPLTLDEVTELYLMGGSHTDYLCQLKLKNAPDAFIQWENRRMWDEKNKKSWEELNKHDCAELHTAWKNFIITVCKELRIDKFAKWLNGKLKSNF